MHTLCYLASSAEPTGISLFSMPHLRYPLWTLFLLLAIPALLSAPPVLSQEVVDDPSYTLNTGDHVQVTVFEEPDLSIDAVLDDTGAISFPLLGELVVRGLTPRDLESRITEGLRGRFLINPRVNVAILEYRPFFVRGEVTSPGSFPFKPGLTVEKAVSMAGGFTARASKSEFYIISDDSTDNESAARKSATLSSRVHPGDVINIEQSFF
jgi:protein involved in polysaccharide export with SLBB domain